VEGDGIAAGRAVLRTGLSQSCFIIGISSLLL
jgi:hypothetical protein